MAVACDAEPRGRGVAQDGAGGKADDAAGFDPALSDHQNAVQACIAAAAKDRSIDLHAAEAELLQCVIEANDAVWAQVQDTLPDMLSDEFTGEPTATKGDETVRIVERLRAAQGLVCEVFGALVGDDEDERDLIEMRCLAQSEVHTANLIDAHFDLGGRRLELVSTTARFDRCDDKFEAALAAGFVELPGPPRPEDPTNEEEWLVSLHNKRRDCMKAEDAELRVAWASDLGESEAYASSDFADRLRVVTGSFERESRAGRSLCSLFSYQTVDDQAQAQAACSADSTMQAGRLYDILRRAPEANDDPNPEPRPTPMPPSEDGQACYPGPDRTWDVCFPIVYPSTPPDGYDYRPALDGKANYRKPIGFIDLDVVDTTQLISKHFTLAEVAHRWKGRYAVIQPHAIDSLQRLRDDVGSISVNSGYRSPAHNESVGGATYSRHIYGDGFDMDPNDVSLSALQDACQDNGGFLVEYTTHVHCDFRFTDVDESFFGRL